MAELPELRTDRLPEGPARPVPPRQLYDRDHTYGVAHDLERLRAGLGPPARTPRIQTRGSRLRRAPLAPVRRWREKGDSRAGDAWHRLRCRTGHHDFRGGHQLQLGSRFEFVERRCIWCDAPPAL